jgi:thymidylate synthase
MWKGFEANMVALVKLIKKEFIEPTDFFLGNVRCFGDNVHIYEDDWQAVEAVINDI